MNDIEDIKVLENIKKLKEIEFKHNVTDREIQAIENLIKKNKELEKENKEIREWKYVIDSYEDLERLKELDLIKIKGKEYISKDKIRAIKEELENEYKDMTRNLVNRRAGKTFQEAVNYEVRKVLQYLLQEGDK